MKGHPFLLSAVVLVAASTAYAQKSENKAVGAATVKATYLVTGLHCPPCTRTVESSLSGTKGIKSVKVDWKTKNATIEFDENQLPAQKVAQLISATPHMMGGDLHYKGWLALKVPSVKDDASAKPAKEALGKVSGIARVIAYPQQHSIAVEFSDKGNVTSQQLIKVLADAGIEATN